MTRMHTVSSKPPPTSRATGGKGRSADSPTAYELHGNPAQVLAALGLQPREARVLVIPSSARAEKKLRTLDAGHPVPAGQLAAAGRVSAQPASGAKSPVIDATAFAPNARSRALLHGARIAQDDLREAGGAYDLDQVRTLLHGVSRQRIDRRVKDRTLLAVPGPSNRRLYPTVQFNHDGSVVAGLKPVLEVLPTQNPWSALNFLVRPDHRLDGCKPIDLLKLGQVDRVVAAAQFMAEQGA